MRLCEEMKDYIKRDVEASLKIEGKEASPGAIEINDRFLNNEIDSKKAINEILKLYGLKQIPKKVRANKCYTR